MKDNLGFFLAKKHPTAETVEAAAELERGALMSEIGRIHASLGELEKQKLFFHSRLDEIKKEQTQLDLEFQAGARRIRKETGAEERYYPNFNYRSIGVRRGLGTPETGGGIWLTEVEQEIIRTEFQERGYSGKNRHGKKEAVETKAVEAEKKGELSGRSSRRRAYSDIREFKFHGGAVYAAAERKKVGTLLAYQIVWLTQPEFDDLTNDIAEEKEKLRLQKNANIKAGIARSVGRTLGKLP